MEGIVNRLKDTDTAAVTVPEYTKPVSVRDRGIDSSEAVSTSAAKNSEEGAWASSMAKTLIRKGDILTIDTPEERDVFGRIVSHTSKEFEGEQVGLSFLKSSLGLARYYTDKGIDVNQHDILKETYDKRLPFQFSDHVEPLSEKDFVEVGAGMAQLQGMMQKRANGEDNKAEMDQLVAKLYGGDGPKKVAQFLAMKKQAMLNKDWEDAPLSADKIMYQAYQDPRVQAAWDKAVSDKVGRKASKGSWRTEGLTTEDKISATLNTFNAVAQLVKRSALFAAQNPELEVTDKLLGEEIAMLPEDMQGSVYDKVSELGNAGALMYANQLKHSIDSHEIFDDMGLMSQFGWGAFGTIADPLVLLTGAKAAGAAVKLTSAIKSWVVNPILRRLGYTATWAAASGVEGTVINTPKLIGDQLYTPGDLLLDIALDTTIGTVLPMGMITTKHLKPKIAKFLLDRQSMKAKAAGEIEGDLTHEQIRTEKGSNTTPERLDEALSVRKKKNGQNAGSKVGDATGSKTNGSAVEGDPRTADIKSSGGGDKVLDAVDEQIGMRGTVSTPEGKSVSAGTADIERSLDDTPVIYGTPWREAQPDSVTIDIPTAEKAPRDSKKVDKVKMAADEADAKQRSEDLVDVWEETGLDKESRASKKPGHFFEKATSAWANITGKVTSHRMQESHNPVMRFIGFNLLEDPKGFAGRIRRHTTAALTSVLEREKMISMINPVYVRTLDSYAKAKGALPHQRFKAAWASGSENELAREFQNEVVAAINDRKMGRTTKRHFTVEKMADTFGKFSDYAHGRGVAEGLPGFKFKRKHYFPQLYNKTKMRRFMMDNPMGHALIEDLLVKGMSSAKDAGKNTLKLADMQSIARDIRKSAELPTGKTPDSKALELARAKARVEMDWGVEIDGKKLQDFIETDIPVVADRYASDVGGRLGLSSATRGQVTTDLDISALKTVAEDRHAAQIAAMTAKGDAGGVDRLVKEFTQEKQIFDDEMNTILGRPTQGGLAPELRNLKKFNMLTRMGILGTSQAIETGNIIARSTLDLFNDPDVVKHLFAMSEDSIENTKLLHEVMNITGRTTDMEYLVRPMETLDEQSLKELSNVRQLSVMLSDKITGGSLKGPASRALSKSSMFNFVQKHQSSIIQKSFLIHVNKYFTTGSTSINKKRMIDLGLMDLDGRDADLARVFNDVVLKDKHGFITDLQWDKWGKSAQQKYMGAAQRDEAQRLQRTFAGEYPSYYNKPLMNLLFQFREVPLVAQNKQLARNAAFADKEACASIMLNIATAGLVRFSWVTGLGATKHMVEGKDMEDFRLPDLNRLDLQRYVAAGGMVFDGLEIMGDIYQGSKEQDPWRVVKGVPQSGLMKDAIDFAAGNNAENSRAEALQGLTLLGNTWYMDVLHTMFVENADKWSKQYKGE